MPEDWPTWSLRRKLHWLRLDGVALIAGSAVMLSVIDVSLRLAGYQRTRALLGRFAAPKAVSARRDAVEVAGMTARIGLIVGIAGRHGIWATSCLRQALLCWLLLSRRAIPSEIRVGVELDRNSGFGAHAWVESAGAVVLGGEHARERYRVLL